MKTVIREITSLNKDLLDPSKTIEWNMFKQYGIDLSDKTVLEPGTMWNASAFYAPESIIQELFDWAIENYKTVSKAYDKDIDITPEAFKRDLRYVWLNMPSSNRDNALKESTVTYADTPATQPSN